MSVWWEAVDNKISFNALLDMSVTCATFHASTLESKAEALRNTARKPTKENQKENRKDEGTQKNISPETLPPKKN